MKKESRSLVLFFVLTFIATWITYFVIVVSGWHPYTMPGIVFLLIGGSAPSWVAMLMVLFMWDKAEKKDYFRRSFSFKQIKLPYWLFILFAGPLLFAILILIDMLMGGSAPGMTNLKAYIASPLSIPFAIFMSFLSGPWSEEFGWRGFSLDPLLERFGVTRASLILGFVWGIWHLPLFFMPDTWHGQMGFKFAGFWSFIIYTFGLTLMMTWVYVKTNRSILSAFMMHLVNNFTGQMMLPYSDRLEILRGIGVLAVGLVLAITLERQVKKQSLELPVQQLYDLHGAMRPHPKQK